MNKFYKFMGKRGIVNPFSDIEAPRARRQENAKWLDPDGYTRWRDLGVRGLDLSGRPELTQARRLGLADNPAPGLWGATAHTWEMRASLEQRFRAEVPDA